MIVAVVAGTPDAVRSDLRALTIRRASLRDEVAAEIRLDLMDPPDLGVFEQSPIPLIATCRRPRDGGRFRGGEGERLDLLRAAAERARWVDVEGDVLGAWPGPRGERLIASMHDFDGTPADLPRIVERLLASGVGFAKVAVRTRSLLDLVALAAAVKQAPGRVIAIGLGPAGAASRILADRLGSAWTYARFTRQGAPPPPELAAVPDLDELVDFHRGGGFDGTSPAFAVVGDRAEESIGPWVFNRILRDRRIAGTYVALKTPSLAGLREVSRMLGIRGLSITTPFKETILPVADRIDASARAIGAANTLVWTEGEWEAWNTDRDGIAVTVLAALRARGRTPAGLSALVVGAGGMGRAAAAALGSMGMTVSMTSRGHERLHAAAQVVGAEALSPDDVGGRRFDVLVNATPAGAARDPKGAAVDLEWASPEAVVVESNYLPPRTPLTAEAAARGFAVVGGDEVYAAQAAAQLRLFLPAEGDLGESVRAATAWGLGCVASS